MPAQRLMLDSGAFAVWSRKENINIDNYSEFCVNHPKVDYFVNLDVIPGTPNVSSSKTPTAIEAACELGWKNYLRMIEVLPKEKVIPVFHQGDNNKWLHKMIDFGAPYIGISPANDRTTPQKRNWLTKQAFLSGKSVKSIITNSKGDPIVRTHGFAVTALPLMLPEVFPWHSVDSATWALTAGNGWVMIPRYINGEWNYREDPWRIAVSDTSPFRDKGVHLDNLIKDGELREAFRRFCKEERIGKGKWEEKSVGTGFIIDPENPKRKLTKEEWKERRKSHLYKDKWQKPKWDNGYRLEKGCERWLSKEKGLVLHVKTRGLMTDDQVRKAQNIIYFQRVAKALGIIVYIAGMGIKMKVEKMVDNRLISYADLITGTSIYDQIFLHHYGKGKLQDEHRQGTASS